MTLPAFLLVVLWLWPIHWGFRNHGVSEAIANALLIVMTALYVTFAILRFFRRLEPKRNRTAFRNNMIFTGFLILYGWIFTLYAHLWSDMNIWALIGNCILLGGSVAYVIYLIISCLARNRAQNSEQNGIAGEK